MGFGDFQDLAGEFMDVRRPGVSSTSNLRTDSVQDIQLPPRPPEIEARDCGDW